MIRKRTCSSQLICQGNSCFFFNPKIVLNMQKIVKYSPYVFLTNVTILCFFFLLSGVSNSGGGLQIVTK